MDEANNNPLLFIIIMLIFIGSVALIIGLYNAIVRLREMSKLSKRHNLKPTDYTRHYKNVPGILNCPCCKSQDILTVMTIKFPKIFANRSTYEPISFANSDTDVTWYIECNECGIKTKEFDTISDAILNWNGRSESTELIKKEE